MEYTVSPQSYIDSVNTSQTIRWYGNNINGGKKQYTLRIELSGTIPSFSSDASLDYKDIILGDLFFKTNEGFETLDFDVNENGELVIIGEDANRFYINENGELIFVEPANEKAHIGLESLSETTDMILGLEGLGEIGKKIQLESDI